jgi:hypothetical protein
MNFTFHQSLSGMIHPSWLALQNITINDRNGECKWKTLALLYDLLKTSSKTNTTTYTAYTLRKHAFVGSSHNIVYLTYLLSFVQLSWYWNNRNNFDKNKCHSLTCIRYEYKPNYAVTHIFTQNTQY